MKYNVILIFCCSFALFLASAAQASEFTDNTCYEESANCQTQSDWLTGWCEAAVAARVVDQTVAECAQAVGANRPDTQDAAAQASEFTDNTCYEEGANCQTQSDWLTGWCEAAVAAGVVDQSVDECAQAVGATTPAQNQNSNSRASSSRQSSDGGQGRGANQTEDPVTLTQSPNPNSSEQSSGGSQQQGSENGDASDGRPVNCRAWIVRRSNPSLFNCFRVTRRGKGGEFLIDG